MAKKCAENSDIKAVKRKPPLECFELYFFMKTLSTSPSAVLARIIKACIYASYRC